MTTLTHTPAPTASATAGGRIDAPSWSARLAHLRATWKALRQARKDEALDRYLRRERDAHERFLDQSTDHYDLERRERDWERRRDDFWRVY